MTDAEHDLGWHQSGSSMSESGWLFHDHIPGTVVWHRKHEFRCYTQPRQPAERPCFVANTLAQAHAFMLEAAP